MHLSIEGVSGSGDTRNRHPALRVVVSVLGVISGAAGVEHGVGEILQGPVRPKGLFIQSWPDTAAFDVVSGEPAMTLVPNLLIAGILTVVVALALTAWSVMFVGGRRGAVVLIGLSLLLLLVGGGFGPPLLGMILGVGAFRMNNAARRLPGRRARQFGELWRWLLGAAVLGYLSLVPGAVVIYQLFGIDSPEIVLVLSAVSFISVILALAAARAHDLAGLRRDPR